jgi:hypothetical protein
MQTPTGRFVKGNVVLAYVKMIKANPGLPWSDHLLPADLALIEQMILPASWYPIEFFQRIGLAVFNLIAKGNDALLRAYGASLADQLDQDHPGMVTLGKPRSTLERYIQIQLRFYSFDAFEIEIKAPNRILVHIYSQADEVGIPVYVVQISGTVGKLIELSGTAPVIINTTDSTPEGQVKSTIDITWEE